MIERERERKAEDERERQQRASKRQAPGAVGPGMGGYIPPQVLQSFMQGTAGAAAQKPTSQHLGEDNKGFNMLQKMGWKGEGQGLGSKGQGITAPVAPSQRENAKAGIGDESGEGPTYAIKDGDDIYEQYKKRMMLGYRYRPNPLNNPRKQYY